MTAHDLSELLRRSAVSAPGSSFVFPDDRYTFPGMDRRCDEFAAMYRSAGLGPGDHIGLWMPASLDMIAAIVACARIGAVAVPVNDRFRTDELQYVVTHGDLAALVTSAPDGHTDRPAELMRALPGLAAAPAPMLAL